MEADAVIIGAGVMGSSVALALAQRAFGKVVVVDADLEGEMGSSALNVGGVRATWWCHANIELSLRSMEYYWSIRDEIQYRRLGYLWLYNSERWPRALEAIPRLNDYGLGVQALKPEEIPERIPEIDCLDDVAGATFSPKDGLVISFRIKNHYQREAQSKGASFLDRWFVTGITREQNHWQITGVQLEDRKQARQYLVEPPSQNGREVSITTRALINAAGPWASRVAQMYGDNIPCSPQRRHIFYIRHPDLKFDGAGLIVDSSGAFIQPFGDHLKDQIVCGYANHNEPSAYRFDWDGMPFYKEHVLPKLERRVSIYKDAEVTGGWARLYENSPDLSGIIGCVKSKPGIYQIHSFSGHGIMQSYGAGQALSELIAEGKYSDWKIVEGFSPERFDKGEMLYEALYI